MLMIDVSTWGWPQWTMAGLYAFSLVVAAMFNGETKSASAQRHNFPVTLVASVIGIAVLASGGFFA